MTKTQSSRGKSLNFIFLALLSAISLILFSAWFVLQDRRLVFLYGHLHATPFDASTLSRYWMAGMVLSGILFISGVAATTFLSKSARQQLLESTRLSLLQMCVAIGVPIFLLISTRGKPPLPILVSAIVALVALIGVSLAHAAWQEWLENKFQALLLWLDGFSLIPSLFLLPLVIDYYFRKSSISLWVAVILLMSLCAGFVWFLIINFLRKKWRIPAPLPHKQILSAYVTVYLCIPVLHYLTSRKEHLYITESGNFFSSSLLAQAIVFLLSAVFAIFASIWRKSLTPNAAIQAGKVFFLSTITITLCGLLVPLLEPRNEIDVWICQEKTWTAVGHPRYEQPFAEECGFIDAILMN